MLKYKIPQIVTLTRDYPYCFVLSLLKPHKKKKPRFTGE